MSRKVNEGDIREDDFKKIGNSRSNNSLEWAGFALVNFVTIIAIFSAFPEVELSVGIQAASGLFLLAGVCCASSWALYEAAGSGFKPKLPLNRFKRRNKDEMAQYALNPREIYVKQAEYFNLLGTLTWSAGVTLLLLALEMYIIVAVWIPGVTAAYLWVLHPYFKWRE